MGMRSVEEILANLREWHDEEVIDRGTVPDPNFSLDKYKRLVFELYSVPCNCAANFVLRIVGREGGTFLRECRLNVHKFVAEMPDLFDYDPDKLPAMTSKQELRALLLKNAAHLQFDNMKAIYTGARDADSAITMINHLCAVLTERTGLMFDYSNFEVQTMVFNVKSGFEVDIDALKRHIPHRVKLERSGEEPFPSARVTFGSLEGERKPSKAIVASSGNSIVTGVDTEEKAIEVVFCTYLLCVVFRKDSILNERQLAAVKQRMKSV